MRYCVPCGRNRDKNRDGDKKEPDRCDPIRLFSCVLYLFISGLDRIAEDVTGPLDALRVCMGVHSESDGLVRMSQLFGYTCDIGSVGDGNRGEAVPKLVGMQMLDPVSLLEFGQVSGRTLRMDRGGVLALREYILTDGAGGLVDSKLLQQGNDFGGNIYRPLPLVLRGVQV